MKISAVIAEYNPFHKGHLYHLQKTCEFTPNSHIVCVMSGNFVQRGLPAITDKWLRTKMALLAGADIVIELPFLYATQSAEGFARGAVGIINGLNCVDVLSFGSESANLNALWQQAALLADEPPELSDKIKHYIKQGLPYPQARQKAVQKLLPHSPAILDSANDILGVEYIKALMQNNSSIEPHCVKRTGGQYNDGALHTEYSSATAIRAEIEANGISSTALQHVPDCLHEWYRFSPLTQTDTFFRFILLRLREMSTAELANIQDVTEGLEYRIKKAAGAATSLDELMGLIKSKRYTHTRISRILLYCLFGVTKETVAYANGLNNLYARVLGFRKSAQDVLSHLTKHSNIPVITKPLEYPENKLLKYDIYASDIYGLLHQKIAPAGRDYSEKLIVI